MYISLLFIVLDGFLLTMMSYDWFVAICHPLHSTVIMTLGSVLLVSWIMSTLYSLWQSLLLLQLFFCIDLEILHYICELNQMVQLICSETFLSNMVICFGIVLLTGGPLAGLLYSYKKIISYVSGMSTAQGKYKEFSICVSHLSAASLFYCMGLGVYLSSVATHSSQSSAVTSVMYTVVTPMLNPIIYSQRNKDIKVTLNRFFGMAVIKRTRVMREKERKREKERERERWLRGSVFTEVQCSIVRVLWICILLENLKHKWNLVWEVKSKVSPIVCYVGFHSFQDEELSWLGGLCAYLITLSYSWWLKQLKL